MSKVTDITRPRSKAAIGREKVDNRLDDIRLDVIEKIYDISMRSGGQQVGALQTLMKVLITPKKPASELIDLNLDTKLSLTDQCEAVITAGVTGKLSPDIASVLAQSMIALCQVKSSDELVSRIEKLEGLLLRLGNE